MTGLPEDLDYLAARIHGRHSRIADAEQLDTLCRIRSLEELAGAVLTEGHIQDVSGFQRRVVEEWLEEMEELTRSLSPPRARMLEAIARRLQVEDQKLLLRGLAAGLQPEVLMHRFLRPMEHPATNLEDFAMLLPEGMRSLPLRPFRLECALDRQYLQGLFAALRGLDGSDRAGIRPLIHQEVDHFHLMLVVRGRFFHGLEAEALLPWHLDGTGITRDIFSTMLSAPDLPRAASRALHLALDALPSQGLDPALLEALAGSRFLRLAHRTFRRGSMEFSTLVGYAALRRVEVARLITLSEGIRLGVSSDALRARMEVACA
ncbi:V-type ATPase subunit [Holophaga foetida]|uniref:V-type ATPase subunit n=1 Tax=Holophaga foetida TaxID=35839 RepID=UPI0002472F05|nr:V-type ATPase subunit [Holophaga foetida]